MDRNAWVSKGFISKQSFEKSLEVTTRRPGEAEDVNPQVESLEEQQLQLLQARDEAASSI